MPHFPGYQILGVVQIFGINGAVWGVGCGVPEPRLSFFVEPGLRPMMVRKERPQNLVFFPDVLNPRENHCYFISPGCEGLFFRGGVLICSRRTHLKQPATLNLEALNQQAMSIGDQFTDSAGTSAGMREAPQQYGDGASSY